MDTRANISNECEFVDSNALLGTWILLYLLLLPLFVCVLYVGYTQRRKQPPSHSDVFTFHIIAMEILAISGSLFYNFRTKAGLPIVIGRLLYSIGATGQMSIHTLTCVERYLAVVHPITYLRLKKRGGIRNVSVGAAWVVSVGATAAVLAVEDNEFDGIFNISLALFFLTVVTVCSLAVLCVLIRPGPGEGGGDARRIDQSKRRAFFTILIILGVLLVRVVLSAMQYLMFTFGFLNAHAACLLAMSVSLMHFPSSVVLPLMFLLKSGKLPKCSI